MRGDERYGKTPSPGIQWGVDYATMGPDHSVKITFLPCVMGLSDRVYVEYMGWLEDGTVHAGTETSIPRKKSYVILRPQEDWSYSDFVCYIDGVLIPIKSVERARDGGTTKIVTELGDFYFPTPFEPELKPTFNGKPITAHRPKWTVVVA